LLTGQATVEGVTNAINNAGLYRYIEKPWETNDLILTVEQAIKSYKQEHQLILQNEQLHELSASLEIKVQERTKDLINLNKLLFEKQQEITSQNEELEKHRNHLESLVKERTRELSVSIEKAEESNRLKAAFMANISHEVRTPMNGLIGFIELLKNPDYNQNDRVKYLDIIERCGKQVVDVITDIVEISRLETKQVKPVLTSCETDSLRDSLNALFQANFDSNPNVSLIFTGFTQNLTFLTDEIKLKQILVNLINNAIKNTKKGSIEFGFSKMSSMELLFFVKDSGIGISKEFHEIIFDRFRQIDSSAAKNQGGTGLGLSISKAYVELLGGKIWLESEPGEGTTFYFCIPYIPLIQSNETNDKQTTDQSNILAGITILVAEDTDLNFKLLKIILEKEKINIIRAFNGEEAVDICLKNEGIDLVLMDVKMPVLDGMEATKRILEFRSDLPIIAQTAYAFSEDRISALKSGCVDYISKPIKKATLIELINKHLVKQVV
jgi:signal transduction histidine kinase